MNKNYYNKKSIIHIITLYRSIPPPPPQKKKKYWDSLYAGTTKCTQEMDVQVHIRYLLTAPCTTSSFQHQIPTDGAVHHLQFSASDTYWRRRAPPPVFSIRYLLTAPCTTSSFQHQIPTDGAVHHLQFSASDTYWRRRAPPPVFSFQRERGLTTLTQGRYWRGLESQKAKGDCT